MHLVGFTIEIYYDARSSNVKQFASFLKTKCHVKLFYVGSVFCSSVIIDIDMM